MDRLTAGYPQRAEIARAWATAAEQTLHCGAWRPSYREEQVAEDLAIATRPLDTPPLPHTQNRQRITWLAKNAAVLRLAVEALGSPRPLPADVEPQRPSGAMSLAGLVTGLHGEAVWWEQLYLSLVHPFRADEAEAALAEVSNLEAYLASAEKLWIAFGSVGELFTAIASGDID